MSGSPLSRVASGGHGSGYEGVLKTIIAMKRPSMTPTSANMMKKGLKAAATEALPKSCFVETNRACKN